LRPPFNKKFCPKFSQLGAADSGNYGKFSNGSNRNLKKTKIVFRAPKNIAPRRQLWLHPAVPEKPPPITPEPARRRLKILYSGRVQGVGFRYTAQKAAAGFEITGSVRNLSDGNVELIAEGARAELEAFRDAIRNEGLAGFIRDETITWSDAQNEFRNFEIVRSTQ
jgi:acylphosphatase